jgi:hypothetical protein
VNINSVIWLSNETCTQICKGNEDCHSIESIGEGESNLKLKVNFSVFACALVRIISRSLFLIATN